MTQMGEAVAVTTIPEEQEKKVKKTKLKIRFSLFFDGTLNNRSNIDEREQFELGTTTKTYKTEGDGGNNSYDNGRTNIAIMEPHIEEVQDPYNFAFKIYIEGQGTFNTGDENERGFLDGKKGDSTVGYAGGSGASGVAKRAKKGYKKAMMELNEFLGDKDPADWEIEKVDIDVFGFSRGAATARYAISLMLEDEDRPIMDYLSGKHYSPLTKETVEVKLAGLYDTVVSVNGSQYSYWADNKLKQQSVKLAKKTLHLAAAEEHRVDFPLHHIKSAKDAGTGREYFLPGVHSDVGGSYNLANELMIDKTSEGSTTTYKTVIAKGTIGEMNAKRVSLINSGAYAPNQLEVDENSHGVMGFFTKAKLIASKTIAGQQYMRTSSEVDRLMNIGSLSSLEIDKGNLIAQGWYTEEEIDIATKKAITTAAGALVGGAVGGVQGAAIGAALGSEVGALIVNRDNIKSAYSNIPLKIMADYATKEAELKINAKLKDRADLILSKEIFLGYVESTIESYIGEVGNSSKPEDWLDVDSKWSSSFDMKKLRHDHLHMSSKMAVGYFPRFDNHQRRRYYYEG
jgi:hypothetical protein